MTPRYPRWVSEHLSRRLFAFFFNGKTAHVSQEKARAFLAHIIHHRGVFLVSLLLHYLLNTRVSLLISCRCASRRSFSFVIISGKIGQQLLSVLVESKDILSLSLLERFHVLTKQGFVTLHIPVSFERRSRISRSYSSVR